MKVTLIYSTPIGLGKLEISPTQGVIDTPPRIKRVRPRINNPS